MKHGFMHTSVCIYLYVCVFCVCAKGRQWKFSKLVKQKIDPLGSTISCSRGCVLLLSPLWLSEGPIHGKKTRRDRGDYNVWDLPLPWTFTSVLSHPHGGKCSNKRLFYVLFLSGDVVSPLSISVSVALRICKAYFCLVPSGPLLLSPSGGCCSFPASPSQMPSYYTQPLLPPALISLSHLNGPSSGAYNSLPTP